MLAHRLGRIGHNSTAMAAAQWQELRLRRFVAAGELAHAANRGAADERPRPQAASANNPPPRGVFGARR